MLNDWNLKRKLVLTGLIIVLLPLLIISITTLHLNNKMAQISQKETSRLAETTLEHIVAGFYDTCEARHNAVQEQVVSGITIADKLLKDTGEISFSSEMVESMATNQYTKETRNVKLPQMMAGSTWLGKNTELNRISPIVDGVRTVTGGTCTIFQKMNDAGDMLRVSTNVLKEDGTRAIGTYIPRVNPDGKPNPVLDEIYKGRRFTGRAFVVNDWYITAYDPIYNNRGEIIGVLYVGVKQDQGNRIRQKLLDLVVGESGYAYVLDSHGKYVISKNGLRDGEDINDIKDSNGNYFIQEICSKAMTLNPGQIGMQRYPWENSDDNTARFKIAKFVYFEPWDWVIGVGAYEDEIFKVRDQIKDIGSKSRRIMVMIFLAQVRQKYW